MIIFDGLPVNNSKLLQNLSNYHTERLKVAVKTIEQQSYLQLVAIGIDHKVEEHYARAVMRNEAEQFRGAIAEQLGDLFDGGG